MKMIIDRETRLKHIQKVFSDNYPYLKLEFFKYAHKLHEPSPKKEMRLPDEKALVQYNQVEIDVTDNMTVAELEQLFDNKAGLSMQVFRRSGSVWIETSLTDDWTLGQQNSEGEMLSTSIPYKPADQ
jgi:hypothetical protein